MALHIGEAVVAPSVPVGESFVIEPEEMQDGGVEVMDVDLPGDRLVTELVGGSVDVAGLDASAAIHME